MGDSVGEEVGKPVGQAVSDAVGEAVGAAVGKASAKQLGNQRLVIGVAVCKNTVGKQAIPRMAAKCMI